VDKLSASRLALGAAQFGLGEYGIANRVDIPSDEQTQQILEVAKAGGISLIDTAVSYGESERRLGKQGMNGWEVVTKVPMVPENANDPAGWVHDSARASLARLNMTRLYGLLLHRPHQLLRPMGSSLYAALLRLKGEGLVSKIGISIYDPAELDQLMPHHEFDLVQAPFNVLDRRLLDSGWLHRLADRGVELHVRSVFLQGLLLMGPEARPAKFSPWDSVWANWGRWLQESGATALQACLHQALSFPEISAVVIGVESAGQLQEILAAERRAVPSAPSYLRCDDPRLVNPSDWENL
jgi:aryl-alcohol dehydrogenase-like predicted oxidoreductase